MRLLLHAQVARCLAVLLALTLFSAPVAAQEADEEVCCSPRMVGERVFDVVLLRPLGAAQLIVGAAFFAVAGPLSWPGGGIEEAFDVFVQVPYNNTFTRKLGSF